MDRGKAWASIRVHRHADAEFAESLAAREAIQLATQLSWQNVIVEGDCATLIPKLQATHADFSPLGQSLLVS